MHPSFPYESSRSRGGEYGSGVGGVRGRGDVLVQSHPGLEDSLVLHNALSSVVEEAQVSVIFLFTYVIIYSHGVVPKRNRKKRPATCGVCSVNARRGNTVTRPHGRGLNRSLTRSIAGCV